jgi:WD40 repeat protein
VRDLLDDLGIQVARAQALREPLPDRRPAAPRLPRYGDDRHICQAFSPDGTLLASGDEQVRLWRVADGALVQTLPAPPEAALVCDLAFAPDGTTLVAGSGDNAVRLWPVADGMLRYALVGPAAAGYVRSVAFAPDGRLLAAGMSASRAVQVWCIPQATLVRTPDGPLGGVSGVAFSPDGALLAWGAADGTVCVAHTTGMRSGGK